MPQENWTDLRTRAAAYFKSSEAQLATNDPDLIQNSLEAAHFAVELALKATIARNGGVYHDHGWRGHDLQDLALTKFSDRVTSVTSKARQMGQTSYINIGLSAWSMDCRYKVLSNPANMIDSIGDYKGLYIWIKNNFLQ